jgi:hypothetical protein
MKQALNYDPKNTKNKAFTYQTAGKGETAKNKRKKALRLKALVVK